MNLSNNLLKAIELDRLRSKESKKEYYESHENIMQFYNCLLKLENGPTMMNYDYWGIDRPDGLHSILKSKKM